MDAWPTRIARRGKADKGNMLSLSNELDGITGHAVREQ